MWTWEIEGQGLTPERDTKNLLWAAMHQLNIDNIGGFDKALEKLWDERNTQISLTSQITVFFWCPLEMAISFTLKFFTWVFIFESVNAACQASCTWFPICGGHLGEGGLPKAVWRESNLVKIWCSSLRLSPSFFHQQERLYLAYLWDDETSRVSTIHRSKCLWFSISLLPSYRSNRLSSMITLQLGCPN